MRKTAMKEIIIFVAALIIVTATVLMILVIIAGVIIRWKKKSKEKDLRILRLDMEKGNKKAELKLQKQLLFFEINYERAKKNAEKAEKALSDFKTIFNLFDPDVQEDMQLVRVPKNLRLLSYEDKEKKHDVFLMNDDLETFIKTQQDLIEQK